MADPYAQPTTSCLPILFRWIVFFILVGVLIRVIAWAF